MNSTENPAATEADDVLTARADDRLAHAYEQIARADEQLARVTAKLSRMETDAGHRPSLAYGPQRSSGNTASRVLIAVVVAGCIGGAAYASHASHGDDAKLA